MMKKAWQKNGGIGMETVERAGISDVPMKDRMHSTDLYLPHDDEIMKKQLQCVDLQYDFNMTRPTEMDKREALMKKMFAEIGDGCYIEPPLHANWGGYHIHLGKSRGNSKFFSTYFLLVY